MILKSSADILELRRKEINVVMTKLRAGYKVRLHSLYMEYSSHVQELFSTHSNTCCDTQTDIVLT